MCFALLANCAIDLCNEVTFIFIYIHSSKPHSLNLQIHLLLFAQKYWFVVGLCNISFCFLLYGKAYFESGAVCSQLFLLKIIVIDIYVYIYIFIIIAIMEGSYYQIS